MARKVKCSDCDESMLWALPRSVNSNNIGYAKSCLNIAKNTIVCGRTMKTKGIKHEQYCKYFSKKVYDIGYCGELERLAKQIEEYEKAGEQNEQK